MGSIVVRFSKRITLPYSSNGMPLTLMTSLSCGLVPRWGGCSLPSINAPSRMAVRLIVSGVTKMSDGLGW